ncbi:hypothetical protein RclHR1_05040005 [Rhizophagus clarus]|uniref:Uncharacterized protein n=1 Tax=Rhizophagus clarus TaxID=94130 RepID=A0A2Z6RLN0_9GLOM|nr:hypothetical protein RclHR1_05040005 [Rhizophagus clarus]GES87509.1 hypothetical protein GLOIN_2v1834901 [Rhizophagus clarus]
MRLYFIFLLLIILSTTILPTKSSITFEEPQPETPSTPRVLNTACYDDNTILVRIVRVNYTAPPLVCVEERLSIRTIYPNGTVKVFDLSSNTLNIQSFNFCIWPTFNPLRYYPIKNNLLLITYAEAEDVNNPYTYNDWGMVIDLNGVIISKTKLSSSFVNTTSNEWLPAQDSITLNVHRDNGFLRMNPINETYLLLQQLRIDENGEIQFLAESYITYTGHPIDAIATMDGGYAVIYPDYEPASSIPLTPYMTIRGFFLQNESPEIQGPFDLYQTSNLVSSVILLDCRFTKVGYGQTCLVVLDTLPETNQNTFIKIDFLSSGTVYNITIFQKNPADFTDFSLEALSYGGYFIYSTTHPNAGSNLNLYGYVLDDQGNRYNWDLPYPTLTDEGGGIVVLPNNTLAIPQPEFGQTWGLITTDLYKIEGARDHGYGNLHIFSTTPNISDVIDPSQTQTLIIKFYDKVDISPYHNITILQDDGFGNGIIRQFTSATVNNGEFIRSIDDYTVEVTVIDSTFNQFNTKYYVLIDDGFVKSKQYQEPILGIQDSTWNFMTMPQQVGSKSLSDVYHEKVNATRVDGKVRLTTDATAYFKSFKHDKVRVKEFFDNLRQELANAVPVSLDRITTSGRHEIDKSVSPEQYILSINVEKAKIKGDKSVNLVVHDLDTLIRNKLITVIGTGEYTNYLDSNYGYVPMPRWIEKNLASTIATLALNFTLLFASYWYKMFAIFKCGNAIENFVTSILFTSIDAGSVENIFTTSLFFVTFPFIVNLAFAFKVVFDELMRNDLGKLLETIRKFKDELLSEGNNSREGGSLSEGDYSREDDFEKDGSTQGLITKVDYKKTGKELVKVLRETRKELTKIKGESKEVIDLTKELKDLNEKLKDSNENDVIDVEKLKDSNENDVIDVEKLKDLNETDVIDVEKLKDSNETNVIDVEKLKDPNENDVIDVENSNHSNKIVIDVEKLKKINNLIQELRQIENFTEELVEDSKHIAELEKLLDELNKNNDEPKRVNVNEEVLQGNIEVKKFTKETAKEFEKELNKIKDSMDGLKDVGQFKKQLDALVNGLKKENITNKKEINSELRKLENFKKELEIITFNEMQEEARKFNEHTEFTTGYITEDNVNRARESNRWSNIWEGVKKWSNRIKNGDEETAEGSTSGQPEKKYRNFSKWLKDHKDNQIVIVLFTILAGVDISHLELLGSKLRINIPSCNFGCFKTRNVHVNFNAKLSHVAENSLFWGGVTNIFITDISTIFLKSFYLGQVVSLGFTPVYTIAKSIIHLITNITNIYKYKHKPQQTK